MFSNIIIARNIMKLKYRLRTSSKFFGDSEKKIKKKKHRLLTEKCAIWQKTPFFEHF